MQVEVLYESQYLSKNRQILMQFHQAKPKLPCSYLRETHINAGT